MFAKVIELVWRAMARGPRAKRGGAEPEAERLSNE